MKLQLGKGPRQEECSSGMPLGSTHAPCGRHLGGGQAARRRHTTWAEPLPGSNLFVFFDGRENLGGKYGGRFLKGDSDIKGAWARIYLIYDFAFAA